MSRITRVGLAVAVVLCVALSVTAAQATTGASSCGRTRCSASPQVAARYVVPPPPFQAKVLSVQRKPLPPGEPKGGGPLYKRLYQVTFYAVKGNAVLPAGHRYSQFAYVSRANAKAPWCFLKGGSGP